MQNARTSKAINSAELAANRLKYPYRLNFYKDPPRFDITLYDFETCALDRLKVLSEIESSMARNRTPTELQTITSTQCNKYMPMHSNSAYIEDLDTERRRDHVSHFVLRLAFCRSEDLRRRFVKAETILFRVKYQTDDIDERKQFLNLQEFGWQAVAKDEKERFKKELAEASSMSDEDILKEDFRKVRWTKVPDLIERRKVFLHGGFAYVPFREQSSLVLQEFQHRLETALELTARALPRLDEDTRILPMLKHLSQGFMTGVSSSEYQGDMDGLAVEGIRASAVNELSQNHFPLCMRHMHDHLRRERHLKHQGRLQYGLFLKILGLSVEEAIAFWRQGFSNITDDKFTKEYRYNIRYNYGLEGKRTNYPARSCQNILTQNPPGPQDCHGCPYKIFSTDNLQTALLATYGNQGLSSSDMPEIMNSIKGQHYHVACTRVFEITHNVTKGEGVGGGESVDHPNKYAARSLEIAKQGTVDTDKMDEDK